MCAAVCGGVSDPYKALCSVMVMNIKKMSYFTPADRPLIVSSAVYGEPGRRTLSLRA